MATAAATTSVAASMKRHGSIFDVPANLFDSCRLLSPSATEILEEPYSPAAVAETLDEEKEAKASIDGVSGHRWTCNTCKAEFDSLQDQRSHFKSDIHRMNVKLSLVGMDVVNEDDFDELTCDFFKEFDISSVSGSEDEATAADKGYFPPNDAQMRTTENVTRKLFIRLQTGERVSLWKCLILNEAESVVYENDKAVSNGKGGFERCLREKEVIERLRFLIREPRDRTHLRVVLLASGGHFAGCIFDGSSVVVHKTFHRYVVRAKAGKKQSSKDASGRAPHSAGASLRRYNELALKKDIQELLASWKPYFDAASCIFIYAPSSNRQLLFDGDKAYFYRQHVVQNVPLNVRRPTFKEARRIYNQLTQIAYEVDEKEISPDIKDDKGESPSNCGDCSPDSSKGAPKCSFNCRETTEATSSDKKFDEVCASSDSEGEAKIVGTTTPLHEAAQSGDARKVLELLEHGLDPCIKDKSGRTPYMMANEKDVRNTFRRFMAQNLDRWDWHSAQVPSALTKDMEESQAAKQAEKDAKRKAKARELKKLRKAREKKAQAQTTLSQNSTAVVENQPTPTLLTKGQASGVSQTSKEEELKRAQAAEREKRAAAAERRMAAAAAPNTQGSGTSTMSGTQPKSGSATDLFCSLCNASLADKVPFHRYNYKYCSTSCMHLHREILEDG